MGFSKGKYEYLEYSQKSMAILRIIGAIFCGAMPMHRLSETARAKLWLCIR